MHNLHFSKNKRIKLGVHIINYPIIIIIITIKIKIKIFKNKGASIKEGNILSILWLDELCIT